MSSIDRRIVEMQFENGQFEKGIDESLRSLEKLKSGLNLENVVSNIEKNTSAIANAFNTLGGKIKLDVIDKAANYIETKTKGLLKGISTDQITAGLSKYELMTQSVQTIKNATGESEQAIYDYLADLNKYTDETSYDFADMANNIGKFTANGVRLGDAVESMKGIANEAAKSGQGITQASRAMYNFSQALSSGVVRLVDWRSIELANMGTKEFKETIIETAKELGTLDQNGRTAEGTLVNFQTFAYTLEDKWFTSDVLVETLKKYADTTTEFGLEAFHAAQQALTFTQSLQAIKDAVSSGWMRTFQIMFGDLSESIDLWTGLCNAVIDALAPISEFRNEVLQGWKDLGGRNDIIKGLSGAFEGLWNILKYVVKGIQDIFPPITAERLKDFSEGIKELGQNIRRTFFEWESTGGVEEIVSEIENPDAISRNLEKGLDGIDVSRLQEKLMALGYDIGKEGVDGIFGPHTEEALKKFQEDFGAIADGVLKVTDFNLLKRLGLGETLTVTEKIVESTTKYNSGLQKVRDIAAGVSSALKIFIIDPFKAAMDLAGKVVKVILPIANPILSLLASIGRGFTALEKKIEESKAYRKLSNWLNSIFTPAEEFVKKISDKIANFIDNGGIGTWIDFFRTKIAELQPALDRCKEALSYIGEKFKTFGLNVLDTVLGLFDWDVALAEGADEISELAGRFGNLGEKIKGFVAKIKSLPIVETIFEKIKTVLYNFPIYVDKAVLGFQNFKKFIGEFINKFRTNKEIISFVDSISGAFKKLVSSFKDGGKLSKYWYNVKKFFSSLIETGKGIANKIPDFILKIPDFFGKAIAYAKEFYEKLKESEKFQAILEKIKMAVSTILEFLKGLGITLLDGIFSLFDGNSALAEELGTDVIAESFTNVADSTEKGFNVFQKVWEKIKGFVGPIVDWVSSFVKRVGPDGLFSLVKSIMGGVTLLKIGGSLAKTIKSFGSIFTSVVTVVNSFSGIGGVVGDVIGSFKGVGKNLSDGIGDFFSTLNAVTSKKHKAETIRKSMETILISLGAIVVGIIVLGLLPAETFKTGVKRIIGIIGSIVLLGAVFAGIGKLGGDAVGNSLSSFGKMLKGLAISILLLSASVAILGNMENETLIRGGIAVLALVATLFGGIKKVGKVASQVKISGMIGVSIAIWVMTSCVSKLGKEDLGTLAKGGIAVVALVATLFGGIKKVGKVASQVKISGMVGVSLAIGVMSFALAKLGQLDIGTILKGVTGLIPVVLMLSSLLKTIGKTGKSSRAGGLIGLAVSLGVMVVALKVVGEMDTENILKGILGLTPIVLGMSAFLKSTRGLNVKSGIGSLITLGGLVLALVGFAMALDYIKNFDLSQMVAFAGSLSALLLAISGATALAKIGGLSGIALLAGSIIAIVGVISLIALAFGELNKQKEIKKVLLDGAEFFGEFLSKFLSPIFNVVGNAIRDIGDAIQEVASTELPDTSSVSTVMDYIKQLASLSMSFPASFTIGEAFATLIAGTPFQNFIDCLPDAAQAILKLGIVSAFVSNIKIDNAKVQTLLGDIETLATIADTHFEESYSFGGGIATFIAGTPFQNFIECLPQAAHGIMSLGMASRMVSAMGKIDKDKVDILIGGIDSLATVASTKFENSFTIDEAIATEIAGTPFKNFIDCLPNAVDGVSVLNKELSNFEAGTISAVKVKQFTMGLSTLADIARKFPSGFTISEAFAGKVLDMGTPFENFIDMIPKIVGACLKMIISINFFPDEALEDTKISAFIGTLDSLATIAGHFKEGYSIEEGIGNLLSQGTPLDNFVDAIPGITDNLRKFAINAARVGNIENVDRHTSKAIDILDQIVKFIEGVENSGIEAEAGVIKGWFVDETKTNSFIEYFTKISGMISTFRTAIEGITEGTLVADTETAKQAMTNIAGFLSYLGSNENGVINAFQEVTTGYTGMSAADEFVRVMDAIGAAIARFSSIYLVDMNVDGIDRVIEFFKRIGFALMYIDDLVENEISAGTLVENVKSVIAGICGVFDDGFLVIDPKPIEDFAENIRTILAGFNQNGSFTEVGETFGQDIVTGISNQNSNGIAAAQNLATAIVRSANAYFTSAKFQMETNGRNLINGLVTGMNNNSGFAVAAMKTICENVVQTARNILKINSPSKVFAEIGGGIPEGMAKGIDEMAYLSDKSVEDLGNGAINTFRTIVNDISNAIDSGIDATPVIRPVIDMSDVYSNAGTISSLFSSRKTMSIAGNVQASLDKIKAPVVNIDRGASNSNVVAAINDMNTRFDTLNQRIDNLQIVLDSGSVVGGIAEKMDKQLGTFAVRKGRGN